MSSEDHWNKIFSKTPECKLGWYEEDFSNYYKLIEQIPNWEEKTIFLGGVGKSLFPQELEKKGAKLILNDISSEALDFLKESLENKEITYLCQSISEPIKDLQSDIWIDRAVLHFLLEKQDIKEYFNNLNSVLKVGGYALFAEFAEDGVTMCAGLKTHRYSKDELIEKLGEKYSLMNFFKDSYYTPSKEERKFNYFLFKRES